MRLGETSEVIHGTNYAFNGRGCRCVACRTWRSDKDLKKFNLTRAQYDEMLVTQDGVCAICKTMPAYIGGSHLRLCVDHNHETGAVRGLLCKRCNSTVGYIERAQLGQGLWGLARLYLEDYT